MRRVAVTGIGVVSPLGNTPDALMASLAGGVSGIRRLEGDAYRRLANPIAAPAAFDPALVADEPKLRMMDRATQFALGATRSAIQASGLDLSAINPCRIGVFVGTGMGGARSTDEGYQTLYGKQSDRINPFSVLLSMTNAAAAWIGLQHGIRGPNLTFSTACSSSAVAIGEAALRIAAGHADVMIAGGTEAPLSLGPMKAWEAMGTIAREDPSDPAASCKPFSKDRSGMVLGEGACFLMLEAWDAAVSRDAPILAELSGYGLANDIAHVTRPSVEGQAAAMQLALRTAGVDASAVDYINAHGTGTVANDAVETAAIKRVFAEHARALRISSTKAMHGHLLGAAGALEFAIAVLAMKRGVVPPTINLQHPDPECDLDYVPNQARQDVKLKTVMSNSFAFGGTSAVLLAHAPGSRRP